MAHGRLVNEYRESLVVDGNEVEFLHLHLEIFEGSEHSVYFRGPEESLNSARSYYGYALEDESEDAIRERQEKAVRWGVDTNNRAPEHYLHIRSVDAEGVVLHSFGAFCAGLEGKDMLYSMREPFF